ncbi:MAG: ABC transporter permease subunit [Anaerolineales bacterium]|nr:ABC transporter permease subunit [Anaerolineales bacterium]MCX7754251.1 ABC transporter permease subunit [Anaerolineales bacterium]MDW8277777.1 ABC transporter permease subunit [Anaerolineales bacterium]
MSNDQAQTTGKPQKPKFRWTEDAIYTNLSYLTMVLPGTIWLILFAYLPMPGIIMAFKNYRLQKPPADHWIQNRFIYSLIESPWVGLDNFRYLINPVNLDNTIMFVRNTVLYNLLFMVVGLVASVALAVIIYELTNRFWAKLYHSIFFLPFFISWVVVAYVVYALANNTGIINTLLASWNMPPLEIYKEKIYWPFIFLFANLWKYTGNGSILYLAIITGIDRQLYEAAAIDGASKWQQFWNITLPQLIPTIVLLQILAVGRIFGSDFDMFYTLPAGSAMVRDVTTTIDIYVFNMLRSTSPLGYPAAAALLQSVLGFILILVTNYIVRKTRPEMALF